MPIAITSVKDKNGKVVKHNVRGAVVYKEIGTDEVILEFYTSEIKDNMFDSLKNRVKKDKDDDENSFP